MQLNDERDVALFAKYNEINNSYKKKCVYHVGIDAGFFSELGAMMECMLYCYAHRIKFVLYADDANFADKNGWEDFFVPFCEMSHNILNRNSNYRYNVNYGYRYQIRNKLLRKMEKADYLTADIFNICIPREYACKRIVKWEMFKINGSIFDEFGKLDRIALRYNEKTKKEIDQCIEELQLPRDYISVQFRGGDKKLEFENLNRVEEVMDVIENNNKGIYSLFILSDDYEFIEQVQKEYTQYRIYTLTEKDERGYINEKFNKLKGVKKRRQLIKLFAAVDICLKSIIHFGNEQTCLNNYIKSRKEMGYICANKAV